MYFSSVPARPAATDKILPENLSPVPIRRWPWADIEQISTTLKAPVRPGQPRAMTRTGMRDASDTAQPIYFTTERMTALWLNSKPTHFADCPSPLVSTAWSQPPSRDSLLRLPGTSNKILCLSWALKSLELSGCRTRRRVVGMR